MVGSLVETSWTDGLVYWSMKARSTESTAVGKGGTRAAERVTRGPWAPPVNSRNGPRVEIGRSRRDDEVPARIHRAARSTEHREARPCYTDQVLRIHPVLRPLASPVPRLFEAIPGPSMSWRCRGAWPDRQGAGQRASSRSRGLARSGLWRRGRGEGPGLE